MGGVHLTESASVQPFYLISVSGRNRVRTDSFHSMVREKYAVFTVPPLSPLLDYFGPDTTAGGVRIGSD